MSDYTVIAQLGDSLVSVLFSEMNADPQISGLIDSEDRVSLESPADLESNNSVRLSMYLYRILENPFLKNRFPVEGPGGQQRKPPLALDLYYLLTPMIGTPREQHIVLGKAMQILYDRAILSGSDLEGSLGTDGGDIRVVLNPVSLEELTRVWQALEFPYRLSVCYLARIVMVDSERQRFEQPVVEKRISYSQFQSPV
jgi:hypothetical protein